MWLGLAVRTWEVEFCKYRLQAETDINIANDLGGRMFGDKIPGFDDIRKAESQSILQRLDTFDIPRVLLAVCKCSQPFVCPPTFACKPRAGRSSDAEWWYGLSG